MGFQLKYYLFRLKFFKIGSTEGIKFRGTRDLTSLTSFINEQLGTAAPEEADIPPLNVNGLTELTESSFNKYIQKGNFFIKFYAPWCGHCQVSNVRYVLISRLCSYAPASPFYSVFFHKAFFVNVDILITEVGSNVGRLSQISGKR